MPVIPSLLGLGFSQCGLRALGGLGALTEMIDAYVWVPGRASRSLPHEMGHSYGTATGLEEYRQTLALGFQSPERAIWPEGARVPPLWS